MAAQDKDSLRQLRRRKPEDLPPPPVLTEADKLLLQACAQGKLDLAKAALEAGASVDAYDAVSDDMRSGKKPLHIAAQAGFDEGVKLLRAYGAKLDEGDMRVGNTPLILTISNSHSSTFRLLLEMGADLWCENDGGFTAVDACNRFDQSVRKKRFGEAIDYFESLPEREDLQGLTVNDLFAPDANGRCLMDTPRMLNRIEEIGEALERQGEHLTLDRLRTPLAGGTSPWEKLCACGKLAETVVMLNRHGEQVQEAALFEADGKPGVLLNAATEWGQAGALFSYGNWQGQSGKTLDAAFHKLPEEAQAQVSNPYQLKVRLDREQSKGVVRGR